MLGALVGGPKQGGEYTDSANDYQCNEVAIDYNATLVAAAAALYCRHIGESAQYIDTNYYVDGTGNIPVIPRGIYVAENSPTRILAGMTTNYTDKSGLEYRWIACNQREEGWRTSINGGVQCWNTAPHY